VAAALRSGCGKSGSSRGIELWGKYWSKLNMNKSRFDKAFAGFIQHGEEKMKSKTFFQVLAEIEQERAQKTIELHAKLASKKRYREIIGIIAVSLRYSIGIGWW
jgi:hypothetical protein